VAAIDDAGAPVLVVVPGDREAKLPSGWRLFDEGDFATHPGFLRGFLGPVGLGVRVVADASVPATATPWVVGANEPDAHLVGAVLGRDFEVDVVGDFVVARAGDRCPRCDGILEIVRAVEAAHIFQLGLTYSLVIPNATFIAEDGTVQPYWMGCYGIGVSRLVAVLAETFHDDRGFQWPASTAPFDVHVCALGSHRNVAVRAAADELVGELGGLGLDVLYDDRDVSAGVSLADADLLGVPLRVAVGTKGLERGAVELADRRTGGVRDLARTTAASEVASAADPHPS
jgi:prolyl-tRNA synthetase